RPPALSGLGLPESLSTLRADIVMTFDRAWDQRALDGDRPQPTRINLRDAHAEWGKLRLRLAGKVSADSSGRADGEIVVKATNWREILDLGVASGAIGSANASALRRGLDLASKLKGDPETLDIPLTFSGGRTRLGPLPIGPAPRMALP
ncbi:MAG: DUF2125 domain-containing protein, partial [Pseudomonadota bacterium]